MVGKPIVVAFLSIMLATVVLLLAHWFYERIKQMLDNSDTSAARRAMDYEE